MLYREPRMQELMRTPVKYLSLSAIYDYLDAVHYDEEGARDKIYVKDKTFSEDDRYYLEFFYQAILVNLGKPAEHTHSADARSRNQSHAGVQQSKARAMKRAFWAEV